MGDKKMGLHMVTFLLLIIGGLNWLVYGLFGWEIGMIFGEPMNAVARVIYVLVGLSAVVELASHKKCCKQCSVGGNKGGSSGGSESSGGSGGSSGGSHNEGGQQ